MHDLFSNPNPPGRKCKTISSAWHLFLECTRFFTLAGAVVFIIPLQGCANQQMVGIDQNNTTVKLRVNEVLQIELPDNASTGFEWHFENLDNSFFMLLGSDIKNVEKAPPHLMGGPYLKSWSFKAVKPGNSEIRLLRYRWWEGKNVAKKKFQLKVIIDP